MSKPFNSDLNFVQNELIAIGNKISAELTFLAQTINDAAMRNEHTAAGRAASSHVRLTAQYNELQGIIGWINETNGEG